LGLGFINDDLSDAQIIYRRMVGWMRVMNRKRRRRRRGLFYDTVPGFSLE